MLNMPDNLNLTYLGQSGFLLEFNGSRLLIDPSNSASGDLDGDIVYCTHSHSDHTGGVDTFLERNESAILVSGEQTTSKFAKWGTRVKQIEDGDRFTHGPWTLEFKYIPHGLFKGVQNLSVIVSCEGFSFAHCGDASNFEGFPIKQVDVLAAPIGGGFTASPGKVISMVEKLTEPLPLIIPIHWLFRNPSKFCEKLHQRVPAIRCVVPSNEKTIDL